MVNEILAKISRGTKMDQIYIPKNRIGFEIGQHVIVVSLDKRLEDKEEKQGEKRNETKKEQKPYFYNTPQLEPIKLEIIKRVFDLSEKFLPNYENIIITGSFLEKGFNFNDVDILIVSNSEKEIKSESLKEKIENLTGIKPHVITLNNKTLISGLSSDPLYSLMLSQCVSKKRIIFNVKRTPNYKLLDINLLKSKTLEDNFEILNGKEKYYFTMNMMSILLFIQNKKTTKETVNKKIHETFSINVEDIKQNLIEKESFIKKYNNTYNKTFSLIMEKIKNEQK